MEQPCTKNLFSGLNRQGRSFRRFSERLLLFFCIFFLAFISSAQTEADQDSGYRYLRLTILDAVGKHKVTIDEINWMVGETAYPATRATKFSNNVTAPQTANSATAWRAYDGITSSPSSVWRPNNKNYPYSIIIDLGQDGAIDPTALQIGIESADRALAAFSAEGSKDGTSWTTLFSTSGLTESDWTGNSFKTFKIPDTEAPTAPENLSAADITQDSFTLNWTASADNRGVALYEVFAGSESKGTTSSTSMAIAGLDCGTAYDMTVVATDAAGNASAASSVLSVSTLECPDTEAPSVPSGLVATDITEESFTLTWDASTDNKGTQSYEVFLGGESLGTTASTSMNVTGLECGSAYEMTVTAQDAAGNTSAASAGLSVNTTECETPGADGYRYLRLTALGGTTEYYVLIEEINWLVGSVSYPKETATSASTNITATVSQETAWEAYDDVYSLQSAWSTRTTEFPYSITIDLGEDEAIIPTGIEIGVEWNGRTMSAFSVQGSVDGSEWTNLYEISGLTARDWERDAVNTFYFSDEEDSEAPAAPAGLSASEVTDDSFTLTWDAATDNVGVVSYEVYADDELLGATNSTSMEITARYCSSTYKMTVTAQDAAGNSSAASAPLSVETAECEEAPNLISNGEFNDGTTGWRTIFHSPAAGSFEVDTEASMSGENAGKLIMDAAGAEWQSELFTTLSLEAGKTYEISFMAKADAARTVLATFQRASAPYNNYWQERISLTTEVQEFGPYRWTSDITDEAARLNFRAGNSIADVWLDAIVVKEVVLVKDDEAPTAPQNVTAANVTESGFTLSWDASTDNIGVFTYEVFAGFASQGTTTSTSMDISGLACNMTYDIAVIARDGVGNVSPVSPETNVTTGGCTGEPYTAALGMNMSSPVSWNSEFIFTNLAHYSMAWMPVETAPDFRTRIPVEELTADRYLQPGATGRLNIFWDLNAKYLNQGEYVFTYDGTAEVSFSSAYSSNGIDLVSDEPGRIVINISKSEGSTFLYFDVTENSSEDPIRNIRFTEIDRENSTDIFRPEIVADYAGLEAFRFMDWMKVNNSTISAWEEYPADNALLQTGNVSLNYIIALANQTGMDAWFTAPLLADDDFLRKLATRIRDELNPDLRAYIELSNEVWNGGFAATGQAAARARELGLTDNTNNKQAAGIYYGYRTAQMENIFEEVFSQAATKPRLTTVVAWQAVDTWSFENMVIPGYRMVMGDGAAPEAVAIAPYFGGSIGSASNEAEVMTWDMDMLFNQLFYNVYSDRISGGSITLSQSFNNMQAYAAIVEKYGIPEYLAYEGGQHMTGHNTEMVNFLADANRDRRMFDANMAYFDAWKAAGGDLFAYFAGTSTYRRSGSWGWKEYPAQTREEAPKYDAVLTWSNLNQLSPTSSPVMRTSGLGDKLEASGSDILVYPNPAESGFVTIRFNKTSGNSYKLINMTGQVLAEGTADEEVKTINLEELKSGLYFFTINGVSRKILVR